jgi:hypothetical protein
MEVFNFNQKLLLGRDVEKLVNIIFKIYTHNRFVTLDDGKVVFEGRSSSEPIMYFRLKLSNYEDYSLKLKYCGKLLKFKYNPRSDLSFECIFVIVDGYPQDIKEKLGDYFKE